MSRTVIAILNDFRAIRCGRHHLQQGLCYRPDKMTEHSSFASWNRLGPEIASIRTPWTAMGTRCNTQLIVIEDHPGRQTVLDVCDLFAPRYPECIGDTYRRTLS